MAAPCAMDVPEYCAIDRIESGIAVLDDGTHVPITDLPSGVYEGCVINTHTSTLCVEEEQRIRARIQALHTRLTH